MSPNQFPGAENSVVVRTSCWSCDGVVETRVRRRIPLPRQLDWRCDDCDVFWSGPGEVA